MSAKFIGDFKKIPKDKKKQIEKRVDDLLKLFSVDDISTPDWKIDGLIREFLAHSERKNLDYSIYLVEPINSISATFGELNPKNNYLIGRIKAKGIPYLYMVELGEFIHIAGNYVIYPPKIVVITTKRELVGQFFGTKPPHLFGYRYIPWDGFFLS